MTHDLLRNVIHDLQASVERVVVSDVKDNTYFAHIHLDTPAGKVAVDARPSDAIALALRTRSPIWVEESVIESAKTIDASTAKVDGERLHQWLESLEPEDLGKYKM
jgi:bifunctional DNase/RNase